MTPELLGLLAVCAIALLAALKMSVRAWLSRPSESFVWSPYRRTRFLHDLSVLPSADPAASISINSEGERGGPPPRSWRGVYRILVTGGSTAECIALDQHHSWPEVIRAELSTPEHLKRIGATKVHVGNIGKSLLPIAAQIRILETIQKRYAGLDLLVCMVGFSDLIAWLEDGAPTGMGPKEIPARRIFDRSPANLGWTWRSLALTRALGILYQWIFRPERVLDTYTKRVVVRRARRAAAVLVGKETVDCGGMMARFEVDLTRYLQLAQSVAKRVIVVRQPWLDPELSALADRSRWLGSFGGSPDSPTQGRYLTSQAMSDFLEQIDQITKAASDRQGIESVEVKSTIPPDLEHYLDDVHLGIKGAEIVGRTVAARILRLAR
jgi:hypothetical protein